MDFIAHRVNTISELKKIPPECGVEVDIRDFKNRLILQHDPFSEGEDFEGYLKYYKHKLIVLNIKSERAEFKVQELMKKYRIKNFFFLDSSFPMIVQLINGKEKNIALRLSEFESLDSILLLKNKVKWVWIDCFTRLSINKENYKILRNAGFKLCFVSPELQGRAYDIDKYKEVLLKDGIILDAVCSKISNINKWKNP
ncbi:MAG: hypothetical protein ISS47_00490 [Candidatus Omnitrophica bacterium]|nr:hypothetical protein [Candidatus Omnitrophota bacterium]